MCPLAEILSAKGAFFVAFALGCGIINLKVRKGQSHSKEEGSDVAKLCDDIERFIFNQLEEQTQVEIQRNILAARFSCAPSQINYVLTTRFTPVQGFRVESRRGGGGFVRVIRIDRTRVEYMEELRTAIGQELTYAAAAQLLDALCRSGTLAPQQARLMLAAVSEEIIGKDQAASQLRARIVGSMLRCAAKEGRTHAL